MKDRLTDMQLGEIQGIYREVVPFLDNISRPFEGFSLIGEHIPPRLRNFIKSSTGIKHPYDATFHTISGNIAMHEDSEFIERGSLDSIVTLIMIHAENLMVMEGAAAEPYQLVYVNEAGSNTYSSLSPGDIVRFDASKDHGLLSAGIAVILSIWTKR